MTDLKITTLTTTIENKDILGQFLQESYYICSKPEISQEPDAIYSFEVKPAEKRIIEAALKSGLSIDKAEDADAKLIYCYDLAKLERFLDEHKQVVVKNDPIQEAPGEEIVTYIVFPRLTPEQEINAMYKGDALVARRTMSAEKYRKLAQNTGPTG